MADDIQSNIRINVDTASAMDSIRLLQNQISAFHTQMSKMGAASAADSRNMQQNLINSINSTGAFTANMTKVRTTAEQFTHSLEKNKLTMGEYFRYAGGASKSFGRLFKSEFETINKVARERVKDLQSQYIKMGRDANGAMQAIKVRPLTLDMQNLGTKTQIAAQRQQLLNQLLKQGSTNLLNFGKNTQWAGRQLMVGFTIPLSIMGAAAMRAYKDIEEAAIRLRRVYGDLGTTNMETEKMVKEVQLLAQEYTKYGVAVKDSMEMAATAAATGKKGAELLAQVSSSARLAVLGGVDQQMALKTTISLTDAFGVSAKQLSKDINFLNAVENQTVLSIEDMTIAIPKAAPVIQQLGGDVKDLAFFLTAMKEGGINASESANALKSGLASLINPTNTASKMLQGFGINLREIVQGNKGDVKKTVIDFAQALDKLDPLNRAKAIEQLFGKFQFARMSTLFKNVIEQGSQASEVLKLASTSSLQLSMLAQKELNKIEQSPLYKFQKAIADFQAQLAPVGEQFMKALTPIINFGTDVLKNFNNLGEGVKGFIVKFVAVAGVVGPVLLMSFGLIANAVANVIKGFALMKDIFNKTGKSSLSLGEQVSYMTSEQIQAAAIASSLDQVHSKLKQTFTSEAAAVDMLTAAYQRSVAAQRGFAVPITPRGPVGKGPVRKYADGGIISGPGTGTSDSILAMVSNGEAIIPAKSVARNPYLVRQLVSGNIPGFVKGGVFDDPYDLSTKIGLTRRDVMGRPGADPQTAQIHARDAIEAGHTLASRFKTADQFLVDIQKSMQDMGYSQAEINKALKESGKKFEEQKTFLRQQGKTEQEIADYKFQTYNERTVLQPGPVNNKGSGSFMASEVKGFYKPGKEGAFAFANFAPHLKSLKLTDQEIEQVLSNMATGLHTSLSKIEDNAQMTLADLDKLTNTAIDDAVENNARMKQAMAKIDSADYTFKTAKAGDNSRVAVGQSYKGKQGKRIEQLEAMTGIASPYQTGGRTIFTRGTFEAAGAEYSPRATQQALRQLQKAGGKFEAEANLLIRQYAEKGAAFIPELFKRIEKQLAKIGLTSLPEIEATVARNVGTISTSMVNGVEKGFNAATQRNSPPKQLTQAGHDSGRALVTGARSQIDDAAVAGKVIGATITQNALGGTRVMSNGIITPGGTQAQNAKKPRGGRVATEGDSFTPGNMVVINPNDVIPTNSANLSVGDTPAPGMSNKPLGPKNPGKYGLFLNKLGDKVGKMDPEKFQGRMFGGSMVAGMASMVLPGPAGQVAGAASMLMGVGGMFKNLGPIVGKLIPVFGRLIPFVGIAVTAFEAFDKIIMPLIRKNADAYAAITETLKITQDKLTKVNDFFGTDIKLTGIRAMQVTGSDQTQAQASLAKQFQDSEQFKEVYKPQAEKLKSLSDVEVTNTLKALAVDLFGQGMEKEQVKAIVDAIKSEAGKQNISISEDIFSLNDPAGQAALKKNAQEAAKNFSKDFGDYWSNNGSTIADQIAGKGEGWMDAPIFRDQQNLEELKANASTFGSYMSGLSGQLQNGIISTKRFNIEYKQLINITKEMPNAVGIEFFNAALASLGPEAAKAAQAIRGLSLAQQSLVGEALTKGVSISQDILNILEFRRGTEQFTLQMQNVDKAIARQDKINAKITEKKKQLTGIQNQTEKINGLEDKINDKYDKRITQIEKIKRLNEQIAKSQQGQLTLAEALNRGDIGAAARAAIDIQNNDIQASLDNQKTGLDEARKAELKPLQNNQEELSNSVNDLSASIDVLSNQLATNGVKQEGEAPKVQLGKNKNDFNGWMDGLWNGWLQTNPTSLLMTLFNPETYTNPGKVFGNKANELIKILPGYDLIDGKLVPKKTSANGGYIAGPGSGTSDDIPAMLSNGEYVIRANAVKTIGVGTLDKLNQADRLGFASGGMVRHFKGGGYNGYKDGGYIPRESGLPTNEKLPADTANFGSASGWMIARPGAGLDKFGNEIPGFTFNKKTGKYNFKSSMDAYKYYSILLKNRRSLVPHIEEKYQEHLGEGWMMPSESNTFYRNNLIQNRTYGSLNGLDQNEAKVFARAIKSVYGAKALPGMWKKLGLSSKLLSNKPMALDKYTMSAMKNPDFYNLLSPSLSSDAPRFSYYANGGMVGCPCGTPGCPGCSKGYSMGGMVRGYKDGGKAYPGAWSTSYLTQEQKDKQARNKLYKKGGYEGFEAGFNSWVQDLMGNPVVGGALKGIGDYLEHDKVTNFALSSLSLPMNIIGSGVNSVMDTIANAQKGKWQDALLSATGIPRLGDAFASSYGHIFDPSHQYKSQFEVAAQTVIDNKWFGTADSNQAALARIIGGSLNVAADPTVYLGAGLATKAAGAASLASKAGRGAVSAGTKVKDAVKTAVAIKSAKNALKAAGTWADNFYEPGVGMVRGTQGIAEKVGSLTPRLGFNLSDDALQSMIKENFYGNMRTGTRSSTSDSLVNRIAVEKSMMGIAEDAPASMTPAYGFLTTKEDMLMTDGSVWNRGAQTSSQQAINNFNQLINPYSRYLQRYGSNTIKLKPNTLGKATISMGDSLSIWDKALGLGQKIPKVNKLSSLASSYPRLHGILESTRNMMRTDIPNIKSPVNFPYIEAHLPGGFTVKDIESIILHPTDRFGPQAVEKIAADLAERKAALNSLLESLGIKGIDITTSPGKQFIDSVLPSKGPRAPMKNPFAGLFTNPFKKPQKPIAYDTMFGPKTKGQHFDELNVDGAARERGAASILTDEEMHYLSEYVARPYTLHGATFDYARNKVINTILRNKFKIDSGTEIVRVANVHDMNLLKNMKPGQTSILDQFLSVANKNHPSTQNFVEGMMKGTVDTGGRSSGKYPLIKFNVKTDIPGINDINNIKPGVSDVSDGLIAPGTGMKLVKITYQNGRPVYHIDLATNINSKFGFNQKGTMDYYQQLADSLPSGHKYKQSMLQTVLDQKSQPISNSRILEFIRSQGGKYASGGMVRKYASGGFVMPTPEPAPTQYANGGMVYAANGGMLLNGKMYGGFANGGMVLKKFAEGGYSMGTDTVPAMLTPGEFVIKKSAVDRIGASTLAKINGYADGGLVGGVSAVAGDSVYNSNTYEINVNVSSNSNPDQIANAVMSKIRQIDNGRVRGLSR